MAYRLDTNISDDQAQAMSARVTREQFERYMNDFAPVEEAMIASIGEGRSPNAAADDATAGAQRARASLERMRERYGTSQTASAASADKRLATQDTALASLGAANTQRQTNEDRDFNLTGQMLNLGNNLRGSAMGGLTDASTNATARENAYSQAKAQHSAQKSAQTASTVASLAGLAAVAFM